MTSSPRLAAVVAAMLVIAALGVMAIVSRRLPEHGSLRVTVDALLSAAEMEMRACIPIEVMLAAHTDAPIVSRASDGTCIVVAEVPPSDAVRDAVAALGLPGTVALAREGVPVLELVVSGRSAPETTGWASDVLRPRLERVDGVARVEVCGVERVVVVRPDSAAMAARSVTRDTLVAALATSHEVAGDALRDGDSLPDLGTEHWNLASLPVSTWARLGDVATVSREEVRTCGDGDATLVAVAAAPHALTSLRERLVEIGLETPPSIEVTERPIASGFAVWIVGADRDVIAETTLRARSLVRALGAPTPTTYLDAPVRRRAVATVTEGAELVDVILDEETPAAPRYRRGGSPADVFVVSGLDEETLRDAVGDIELPIGVAIEVVSH